MRLPTFSTGGGVWQAGTVNPPGEQHSPAPSHVGYFPVDSEEAVAGNASYWSDGAREYLEDFGEFLGPAEFRWCPEGLTEEDAALLGPLEELRSQSLLEVGAGAGQCSRWLKRHGVRVVATDIAPGMVEAGRTLNLETGIEVDLTVADARSLPFPDATFDQVFTAFGAIPFVKDATQVHREVHRVLKPGGWWTFATTHPIRWAFPDDPTSLTAVRSYFDRTPYAERLPGGTYAEFHRTLGDHVREVLASGFTITRLMEPEWSEGNSHVWGGWGPERGAYLPGTLIIRARAS